MSKLHDVLQLRVRYSETDQMGTFYNSRALEWFEQGRAELLRSLGKPYREMEQLGVMLPVVDAHIEFLGRAEYDDVLRILSIASMSGKARLRVDVDIEHAETARPVCRGYTVHAVTNLAGKPIRPPEWLASIVPPRGEP